MFRRYLGLYAAFWKNSVAREMGFKANFLLWIVTEALWFALQLAFIVAFGVLLDTVLVRSLLVPALSYDLGRRIWWPARLATEPVSDAGIRNETETQEAGGRGRRPRQMPCCRPVHLSRLPVRPAGRAQSS